MRTTLDIDDDVLAAAKALAKREKKSTGLVLSELARRALNGRVSSSSANESEDFFGFRPFPRRGNTVITNELIDRLREDDVY